MLRIFLIGYMGSGKTSIGIKLSDKLNLEFIDMDHFIEEKYHKTVSAIFSEMGQDKFREIEHDALREIGEFENVIISTGGGAPCFFDNMDFMNKKGYTVYLKHNVEHLIERLENSRAGKRPLLAERKGEELKLFITEGLTIREPFYTQAQLIVSGLDEEMIASIVQGIDTLT